MGAAENRKCYISKDAIVSGKFIDIHVLTIDGKYEGALVETAELYVGKTGKIKAEVKADFIIVEGIVIGSIRASNRIILMPTAQVLGDIHTKELIIQKGVIFEGNCFILNNVEAQVAKQEILKRYETEN